MKTESKNFSRIQVRPTLKDDLKAIAASRHTTLRALTEQVLDHFVQARHELLAAAAENNGQEGEQ